MKINATTADLHAVAEALKFSAIIDDRAPRADKARIAAWAEMVQRHNLTECDLLDGVQDFYDSPSDRAIQVGDLIHYARQARTRRLSKDQEKRQAEITAAGDQKAADAVAAVASGFSFGRAKRTPRLEKAELGLQCAVGAVEAKAAIREYLDARKVAGKAPVRPGGATPAARKALADAAARAGGERGSTGLSQGSTGHHNAQTGQR